MELFKLKHGGKGRGLQYGHLTFYYYLPNHLGISGAFTQYLYLGRGDHGKVYFLLKEISNTPDAI